MAYKSIAKGKVRDLIWAAVVVGAMVVGVMWFIWYFDPFEGQAPAQTTEQAIPADG